MSESENLFPTLGDVASRTDALADVDNDDARLREGAPPLVEQEEGEEREMQEIESLCMRCHEQVSRPVGRFSLWNHSETLTGRQGVTRILLTSIPYFKEIVVSSFRCEHCGHRDTEIQSAGEIQRESVPSMDYCES
jgi:zinc finger protein